MLPDKSKQKYINAFNKFEKWRIEKNTGITENILIAYFSELSKDFKPSSLWSNYSMLRSTININHNVDITKFTKLISFLKKNEYWLQTKEIKYTDRRECKQLFTQAPDYTYLVEKVCIKYITTKINILHANYHMVVVVGSVITVLRFVTIYLL